MGLTEKAASFEKIFKDNADNDHSIYQHLNLAAYYAYRDEPKKAIEHLTLFFFYDATTRINGLSTNIREHYFIQQRGGSASNRYIWELLSEFDQLESIFHDNYIDFEGFSDFGILL